jgi:hypothetical protein
MFRKTVLALSAIAALGAASFAPTTAAEAKKFHFSSKHLYSLDLGYVRYDDCYQYRLIETRRGLKWRLVNVCW